MGKKTPVVHSSASDFSTEGVLSGHGPSSKVSTTSLSRRKSSCLKCSKPNPGPPVVSISTTRPMPSASGLAQGCLAGAGVAAAAGADGEVAAGAGLFCIAEVCDQAACVAHNETALAKISPAAIRICCSFIVIVRPACSPWRKRILTPSHHTLVGPPQPRQRLFRQQLDLWLNRLMLA